MAIDTGERRQGKTQWKVIMLRSEPFSSNGCNVSLWVKEGSVCSIVPSRLIYRQPMLRGIREFVFPREEVNKFHFVAAYVNFETFRESTFIQKSVIFNKLDILSFNNWRKIDQTSAFVFPPREIGVCQGFPGVRWASFTFTAKKKKGESSFECKLADKRKERKRNRLFRSSIETNSDYGRP